MRRLLVFLTSAAAVLAAFASPATAQSTISFEALFHEEFEGASPYQPCPTGDPEVPCGVGHVKGFGKATVLFEFIEGEAVDSCFHAIFVTTIELLDGGGTLMLEEDDLFCTPGVSAGTPGNQLHSFGNPFTIEGTWTVIEGSGVFAGATGSGTNRSRGAGDVIIDKYTGSILVGD